MGTFYRITLILTLMIVNYLALSQSGTDYNNSILRFFRDSQNNYQVRLDQDKDINSKLQIITDGTPSWHVAIGDRLVYENKGEKYIVWSIDSLFDTFSSRELDLTFLDPPALLKVDIIDLDLRPSTESRNASFFQFHNFYLSVFIILILTAGILFLDSNNERYFAQNFRSLWRKESLGQTVKLNDRSYLILIGLHTGALSLIALGLITSYGQDLSVEYFPELITAWAEVIGLILILLLVKYGMIVLVGQIFGLRKIHQFQMKLHLDWGVILFWPLLILVSIGFFASFTSNSVIYWLKIFLIFLIALRVAFLYFKLGQQLTFKTVHLFSYLCVTEIIPVLVAYKLILEI